MFLVRPAREGLLIPKPDGTGDLAAAGEMTTEIGLYWYRRRADGDVMIDEVSAETVAAALTEIEGRRSVPESKPTKKG